VTFKAIGHAATRMPQRHRADLGGTNRERLSGLNLTRAAQRGQHGHCGWIKNTAERGSRHMPTFTITYWGVTGGMTAALAPAEVTDKTDASGVPAPSPDQGRTNRCNQTLISGDDDVNRMRV
jgi:hypothetical protein